MALFKNRPLALICFLSTLIMACTLLTNRSVRVSLLCVLAAAIIIFVIITVILHKKNYNPPYVKKLICVIIFLILSSIMLGRMGASASEFDKIDAFKGKDIHITGKVNDVIYNNENSSALDVTVSSLDGKECSIKTIMKFEEHLRINKGDEFSLVNKISSLNSDYAYLMSDGFCGMILCSTENELKYRSIEHKSSVLDVFKAANHKIQEIINSSSDEKTGALAGALLLGSRENLRDETIRDFRRCGISHMLALSGLHMSIIIGFFDLILRSFLVNKRIRCVILIFAAIAYLALTGFSPSASRAVIMLCIVYVMYLLSSDADSITSLFIALVMILSISPMSIYDVGLWLSFFATLGIITVSEITSVFNYNIRKKPFFIRLLIKTALSIIITFSAVFSVCLFTWLFFGEISLISPLTNLIFSPIMTAVLVLGLLTVIFSPLTAVSSIIGEALVLLCTLFEKLASHISHLKGITVSLKYNFVPYIIIPLCIFFAVFLVVKIKHKWIVAIPPCLAIIAFVISLNAYNTANIQKGSLSYLKDKRNEVLILSTVDKTSVCDISSGGFYSLYGACKMAIEDGATEIENIILTHYHNYHDSTLTRICNKYIVRNVYLPLPESESDYLYSEAITASLARLNVNVLLYKRESPLNVGHGYNISVSKIALIKRSSHPIFTVSVSNDANHVVYASSAINESLINFDRGYDVFIFGSHGPNIKPFLTDPFFESLSDRSGSLIFTSPNEMLKNKDFVSYVNILYQKGVEIILDNITFYRFEMTK